MLEISDTFFLEDYEDPVAVNMFVNSSNYELFNDENIASEIDDDLLLFDSVNESSEELFDDYMSNSSTSIIDTTIDEEIEIDRDVSDYDGEIIDMIDGLV